MLIMKVLRLNLSWWVWSLNKYEFKISRLPYFGFITFRGKLKDLGENFFKNQNRAAETVRGMGQNSFHMAKKNFLLALVLILLEINKNCNANNEEENNEEFKGDNIVDLEKSVNNNDNGKYFIYKKLRFSGIEPSVTDTLLCQIVMMYFYYCQITYANRQIET